VHPPYLARPIHYSHHGTQHDTLHARHMTH
jgi:hypothetical protein